MSRISIRQEDNTTTITVHGDFVFDVNREFRDAYQSSPATDRFVVDLKDTAYMDSAGLGMLIQLRDYAGGQAASIRLVGLNDTLRTILNVANFGRLFSMG
jgi:anti-anti-sigma factor